MTTFQLKDGFGLDETITPGSGAVTKYFQNAPDVVISGFDLAQLAGEDLTNPAVKSVQADLSFSKSISIGKPAVELTVGANLGGGLSIFVPATDGAPLFNPDVFGDNVKVSANRRYVSFSLNASLNGGASVAPGDLKFGFNGKSNVALGYFERFGVGTTVLAAVEDTIAHFCIPADLDDIAAMPEGSIATVESSGDLKFSGSANLLSITNPLATANLPQLGTLGITGGAAIKVGADYELTTDYQVRVTKLPGDLFHLGFYRKRNSQFDFSVDANASLSVKLGDNDLFAQLMQKISSDPTVDLKQLEAAGLSEDQSKAIQTAIKSAINRSLEIGVSIELSRSIESDAMFLYEVDLNALQADGRALLHPALEGDLSGLVNADTNPPEGIKVLKTLISSTKTFQHSFKLNLLGIYNVLQLSKLMIQGSVAWDATTGEVVLTDQVTADKIKAITSNLQVNNSAKLRQILAEHFMITAAYRAVAKVVSGPPDLSAQQTFFALEHNPSKVRMRDYLFMPVPLGLETAPAALSNLPVGVDDFGETTVYAETGYDDAAFRSLFFNENDLQEPGVYKLVGRYAIQSLVRAGDDDDFRLIMATNDNLFNTLAKIGNVGSADFADACVNAGVPKDMVPVVGTDYLNVSWFAEAMTTAGARLQTIDQFLENHANVDPDNHDFKQLKQQLTNSLAMVVGRATTDFGGPWGFETMSWLGKASSKKWMLVNHYITSALS